MDDDEEVLGWPVMGGMSVGSMGPGRPFGSVAGDDCVTFSFFKREKRLPDAAAVLGLTGTLGARLMTSGEPLSFVHAELIAGVDWV